MNKREISMKTTKVLISLFTLSILLFSNTYAQDVKTEIALGCETSLLTAPVWVAEKNGYFQKEGLNLDIIEFDSGKASFAAMLDKRNIDICTVAQTPIMFNSFESKNFVILAAMVTSDNDVKVLARQDRGIKEPSDLRGKRVGITKGSTGEFFLDLFLVYKGIVASEIETIGAMPSELPQILAEGRVDAICTWEPHILNARKLLNEKVLVLPSKGYYREDFYFVTNKKFAKKNPATLKKFLSAIDRAEGFIKENEKKSINIVAQRLKLPRDLVVLIWREFDFRLVLDQTILTSLEDEARWAIRSGLTDKNEVPNYLDFIYMDALEQIKPGAVTIIR